LHEILGPVTILAKGQRTSPQMGGVLLGEPLKGSRVPSLGTADQLALVVLVYVHLARDSLFAAKRFTRRKIFCEFLPSPPLIPAPIP
jgi:hypothetical protein